MMQITDKKFVFRVERAFSWWSSHTMAPCAVAIGYGRIRVFVGAWDSKGISRIGFVDVSAKDPTHVLALSQKPVLDIGNPGCFDENGVFPGHALVHRGQIYLYYTGFQLGHRIRHYNFGGLAVGNLEDERLQRVSAAPLLDRSDEGLFVRAGQSCIQDGTVFRSVYSAGSAWITIGGRPRPVYDIFYQESDRPDRFKDHGRKILGCRGGHEHGLGRPQIVKRDGRYYVFYTRRTMDMCYFFGVAESRDCKRWKRIENQAVKISHSKSGWDSKMVYFPSYVNTPQASYLFYSGNDFGLGGLGVASVSK